MKKQINVAVIAAGGYGTRFLPFTKAVPKELLPIGDIPAIEILVNECIEANINKIFVIVRSDSDIIQKHFSENLRYEAYLRHAGKTNMVHKVQSNSFGSTKMVFVKEEDNIPYGNARGLFSIKDFLEKEEAFLLLFGDDIVLSEVSSVKGIIASYMESDCDAIVGAQKVPLSEVPKYGNIKIKLGTSDVVERIIQKPRPEQIMSDLVIYSQLILTPEIFKYLNPGLTSAELDVGVALSDLAQNKTVRVYVSNGKWVTIGDPVNFIKANLAYMIANGFFKKEDILEYIQSL